MRKIISLCFLLGLAPGLWSAPWGAMRDFDQPLKNNSPAIAAPAMGARYLMPKILAGQPIRIYVSVSQEKENRLDKYQTIIAENYNKWFTETASIIQANKRQQEFGDILPLLQKGIQVNFVNREEEADIVFFIVPFKTMQEHCGAGAGGCYFRVESPGGKPRIYLPEDHFWLKLFSAGKVSTSSIGLHEIGHSLGLSDQYEEARDANTHDRYSSMRSGKGTMKDNSSISCDEADGIINLIDLTRHTVRGAESGWKSLCPRSDEFYVRGQSASKGPFLIEQKDHNVFVLHTYKQGKRVASQTYTFQKQGAFFPTVFSEETVLKRDALGRPVKSTGPNGEDIYYSYQYEQYLRLVVQGKEAVLAEFNGAVGKGRRKIRYKTVLFNQNDRLVKATAAYGRNKAGSVEYQEATPQAKSLLYLSFNLDEKGNISQKYVRRASRQKAAAAALPAALGGNKIRSSVEKSVDESRLEQIQNQLIKWFKKGR